MGTRVFCGGLDANTQKESLEAEASCWPHMHRLLGVLGGKEGVITRESHPPPAGSAPGPLRFTPSPPSSASLKFSKFGRVSSVWIARNPPGFGFVTFDDDRDADDAVANLDGKNGWKVERARPGRRDGGGGGGYGGGGYGGGGGSYGGGGYGGGGDRYGGGGGDRYGGGGGGYGDRPAFGSSKCYACGEMGHFARECPTNPGGGGGGGGGRRSYDDDRRGGYDRRDDRDRYDDRRDRRDDRHDDRRERDRRSPARSRSPAGRDRRDSPAYD